MFNILWTASSSSKNVTVAVAVVKAAADAVTAASPFLSIYVHHKPKHTVTKRVKPGEAKQCKERQTKLSTQFHHPYQTPNSISNPMYKKSDRCKKYHDQSSVRSSKKSDKNHKKDSDNSSIIDSSARSVASNGAKKERRTQQEETTSQQKDGHNLEKHTRNRLSKNEYYNPMHEF